MATSSASNPSPASRKETDRLEQKGWLNRLLARPEIGPIGVMLLLFGMLGYFSIPAADFHQSFLRVKSLTHLVSEIICVLSHSLR